MDHVLIHTQAFKSIRGILSKYIFFLDRSKFLLGKQKLPRIKFPCLGSYSCISSPDTIHITHSYLNLTVYEVLITVEGLEWVLSQYFQWQNPSIPYTVSLPQAHLDLVKVRESPELHPWCHVLITIPCHQPRYYLAIHLSNYLRYIALHQFTHQLKYLCYFYVQPSNDFTQLLSHLYSFKLQHLHLSGVHTISPMKDSDMANLI